MSDRRAELERKKAKLQALREEKDRRRREKELKDVEDAAGRAHAGGDNRKDIDEMLSSLGVAPVSDVLSSLSSMNSITPEHSRNHTPDTSLQLNSLNNARLVNYYISFLKKYISQFLFSVPVKKKEPQLCVVSIQTTNIPPKESVMYTKQTQTTATGHERDGEYSYSIYYNIYTEISLIIKFTSVVY